jgi:chorismate--pyruvate lyase
LNRYTPRFHDEPLWRPRHQWRRSELPEGIASWLLDPGSLTRRLQQTCGGRFRVQLLAQGWGHPLHSETAALHMRRIGLAVLREVLLLCDGQPWVYARSVIPRPTLTGSGRQLTRLGTRPLGAFLFADPTLRRSRLELARIEPGQRVFAEATRALSVAPAVIWGRRSLFFLRGRALLVNEIFLPGIPLGDAPDGFRYNPSSPPGA